MHLKSIDLTGFKTFADSTHLQFGPGITAIVGPNGSGKSNLVDAMLWVLGERSHKALRTGESIDVIFSGNRQDGVRGGRRPTGMAEVSLTVDNSDGVLPVEFSEVTVTRRLYRDGESEYLLNKTVCRLRDIVELFLDSGVGAGTYSIVGQTEIDAVLSAKPEDRRELLEHAAGVQKYRFKRAEAKRKLERAEQNLMRVRDIMHELESQLAPLAQQAEVAREYEQYQQRLRQLTLALLARDYEMKVRRLENLAEQRATVQETLEQATESVAALEAEARARDQQLRAMEGMIATLQRQTTETITQVKATEGNIAVAEERMRALAEQREFLIQEIGILESRVVGLQHQRSTAQQECTECEAVMAQAGTVTQAAEQKFNAASERMAELARALDQGQDNYLELMRRLADARNLIGASQARADNHRRRLEALARIQESIAAEQRDSDSGRASAETTLAEARAQLQSLEDQRAVAQRQRDAERAQLARLEREWNDAQRSTSEARARLATLEETQRNLEGCDRGVRAALQQQRDGKLTGPLRLFGELIRSPKEYERAIESALGDAVQTLASENETTAQLVFEWLRANAQGRASVLPRDLIRRPPPPPQPRSLQEGGAISDAILAGSSEPVTEPGSPFPSREGGRGVGWGRAADLVECDDRHRDFVEALLGDVWIVADRNAALAGQKEAPRLTFVTLEGQTYHANGMITGGDAQQGVGYLSRRREIEELRASAQERNAALAALTNSMTAARDAIAQSNADLDRVESRRVTTLSTIAALEREVDHWRRELNRLVLQQEQLAADIRELGAEAEREDSERSELESQLVTRENECRQLDLTIAGLQHQSSEASRLRDEAAQEAAEVRAQQSGARERLFAVRKFLDELDRHLEATKAEIEDKRNAAQRALAADRQLREQTTEDRRELVVLRERQAEADQSFDAWRRDRLALVEQLEQVGARLRAERGSLHDAETELHKIDVRETQTRTEREESERRFREEFQQSIAEALTRATEIENKQAALEEQAELREKLRFMGSVNVGAISQQQALQERMEFLVKQRHDLELGKAQLEEIIAEIDGRTREQFLVTFEAIQREFEYMFLRIFDGGSTKLSLTDPDHLLETGVDIRVQLPGKAEQDLMALSGGERALTALSLLLALLRVKPSPFCVLDEVDAPLDQSNVDRFSALLREFGERTQFIVITHNSGTMEAADALYGVTMQEQGVSKLVSMRLVDAARPDAARPDDARQPEQNRVAA